LPLWLFLLPAFYVCSSALFNYLHKITECTFDIDKPMPLVALSESMLTPTPANKLIVSVLFLLTLNQQLDNGIHIFAYLVIVLLAPIIMLIIALEPKFSQLLNLKLYINTLSVLGKNYIILMLAMCMITYCLYYFAWHQASFLNVVFSLYLLVVYHRYIGLLLRNHHEFYELPAHWIINHQAKKLLIENDEVRKCQRIIQNFQRYDGDPTLNEKLRIYAKRTDYKDGDSMFLALQQLQSAQYAKAYSLHYAKHLMQAKNISNIRSLLQWNANQNNDFFLDSEEDNESLLSLLIAAKYFGLARYVLESCCKQKGQFDGSRLRKFEAQILDAKPLI
jgi:hypothetical protein